MTDPKDTSPLDLAQFEGHTPGPWFAEAHDSRWSVWHSEGVACVADVHGGVEPDPGGGANARLIAAAPALLDEVRRLRAEVAEARESLVRARRGALMDLASRIGLDPTSYTAEHCPNLDSALFCMMQDIRALELRECATERARADAATAAHQRLQVEVIGALTDAGHYLPTEEPTAVGVVSARIRNLTAERDAARFDREQAIRRGTRWCTERDAATAAVAAMRGCLERAQCQHIGCNPVETHNGCNARAILASTTIGTGWLSPEAVAARLAEKDAEIARLKAAWNGDVVLSDKRAAERDKAERALEDKDAEIARLRGAVIWALGYTDFRPRRKDDPAFWWRAELSERAGITWVSEDEIARLRAKCGEGS